jgi:peptide/nickel transport system permease protein
LRKSSVTVVLASVVAVSVVVAGLAAPVMVSYGPLEQNVIDRLLPPMFFAGGSSAHVLGTDQLGRDVLARLLYGARIALLVGGIAVSVSACIGLAIGLLGGYYGGAADTVLMRLLDIQLSMPFMLLALVIIGIYGPSLRNIIIVLTITGWVVYARVIRSEVLSLRTREFVTACRSLGGSNVRIITRHVLPNVLPSFIVLAALEMGRMMLLESALSFLGLGIRPPNPSWGSMLADGRVYVSSAWWLATCPGVAVSLTVLSLNVVADRFRDVLDSSLEV